MTITNVTTGLSEHGWVAKVIKCSLQRPPSCRLTLPQPAPTPCLCALLAGRGVYGEAVPVERGAG